MARRQTHPLRNGVIAFIVVSALLWLVAVVPLFLVGIGMGGLTVGAGLDTTLQNATAGDPMSIAMVLLTVALFGLPWAVWVLINER